METTEQEIIEKLQLLSDLELIQFKSNTVSQSKIAFIDAEIQNRNLTEEVISLLQSEIIANRISSRPKYASSKTIKAARTIDALFKIFCLIFTVVFPTHFANILTLLFLVFFIIGDGLFSFQNIGNVIGKITIVNEKSGEPCSIRESVIRNAIWILALLAVLLFLVNILTPGLYHLLLLLSFLIGLFDLFVLERYNGRTFLDNKAGTIIINK